jgi:hypothetical protein
MYTRLSPPPRNPTVAGGRPYPYDLELARLEDESPLLARLDPHPVLMPQPRDLEAWENDGGTVLNQALAGSPLTGSFFYLDSAVAAQRRRC